MFQPAPRRHRRLPTGTMVSYAEVKSYLSKREIPQLFESLMAGLMYHRPENHIGYLQSCLEEVRSNSETKVQWSTFVNAKKRKSKEILPPLTPKKQDSFSSSWSDNSRQSTPLPPISARTRTRTSLEQRDLRNTYILYHNPPPILAKPKVPVISVLGGLGTKIDELCERVVGRLRGVVHISTCSMLKTRMTIEGFYRVTSVPACAVVDSVLQAMSMVQSANALLVAGFPRNRGDIEEYRSRRVRMDGVVLVDFEEEALRRFLEHEVATGVVRKSDVEAELERFKQDIISVAEYYDEKELLTVVMGDQDQEEIIDDLVLAVDKVIETRKDFVDEDTVDVKRDGECDGPYNAIIPSPDRLERPSTVEIRDATEEDIKSLEVEANKSKLVEAIDIDELSTEKANSVDDATKLPEDDGTVAKEESEIEGSDAKPEEDMSNNSGVPDNMEVAAVEKADLKEMIDGDEINEEKNVSEEETAVERSEEEVVQKSDEDVPAEKSEAETEAPKSEEEAEAEKSEKDTADEKSDIAEEKSEVAEVKSEENVAAEVSESENKEEKSEGEKTDNDEGEKEEEKSKSEQNAEGEKEEKSENGNEEEKSEEEKGSGLEGAEDQKEEEEDDKDIPKDSESSDQSPQPSDIKSKDVENLNSINNSEKGDEKPEEIENNGSENNADPTDDKEASEKNTEEELHNVTPNIPLVFAFENINIDYDEIRNLIANDLEMCFIDFHELMRNDGSNDDKFDNDEALRMLSGILKQDSVSYSNGFFVFKFPFSLLDENNIEELLKLGNLSFVCKVRENKSESESESKEVKEEKLFHSSLSEKVKIIFVTEDNVIDELRQALQEMIENKNAGEDKDPEDKVEEAEETGEKSEKSDGSENKTGENIEEEEKVSSADGKPSPEVNENEVEEGEGEEKEDESNKNGDTGGEEKKDEKDEVIDKEIPEKEDVVTEEKTNQDDYEDSTGKDIEDLVSDDTLNEGSKPPESLQSEENQNIPDEAEDDNTHSQASALASADDETQKERATLERQSDIEMETDNASVNEEDDNKPKLVRQSTYSADEEIKNEDKEGTEAQETSQNEELPKVESIKETSETKNEDEIEEGSSPKQDVNISEPVSETKETEDTAEAENENASNNGEEKGDETSEPKEEETEVDEDKVGTQSEAEKSVSEEQQPEIENKEDGEGEGNENAEIEERTELENPVSESPDEGNAEAPAPDSENENSNQENSASAKEAEDKENTENDDGSMKESPGNPEEGETGSEQANVKENDPENLSEGKIEPIDDSAKSKSENEGNEIPEGSNAEEAEQEEKDENEESVKENSETKENSEKSNQDDEAINDNENVSPVDQESGDGHKIENEAPTPNEEISKAEITSQEEEKEISQKSDKDVNEEGKGVSPEIGDSAKHKALDNDSDSNDENVTIETQAEIHAVDCESPPAADAERSGSKNDDADNENLDQNEDDHSSAKNKKNESENETSHKETILGNETEALTIEDMDGMGSERYSGKRQERNGSGILDESREQDQRESEEPQERSSSSSRGEL